MAFSTIAAYMVFFFAMVIMVSSVVMIYSGMVDSSNLAYNVQRDRMEDIVGTRISVSGIGIYSGSSPDTIIINLTSAGTSKLRPEMVDVYIDGVRIPRTAAGRAFGFPDGTNVRNPLLWDPYELLQINVSLDVDPGEHVAEVTTEHGVAASRSFTV
jgi:archaellum component FlaF (FlaF/FlaG flagellin family)